MARCRLVEGRRNNLPFDTTLHISDFFGAFVNQQNDQVALGVVLFDRIRDVLQQNRFTGPWRRHDQAALALTDGRYQIDDTRGPVLDRRIIDFHCQTFIRVKRRQVFKGDLVARFFRLFKVDLGDICQREIPLRIIWRFDQTFDCVSGAQRVLTDHLGRDVNVIGARQIVRFGRPQEAKPVLQNFQHTIARDFPAFIRTFAQDLEHHFAFTHGRCVFDLKLFGHRQKILGRLRL